MSSIDRVRMYWRFASGLRRFLSDTITPEQSRKTIEGRLQNRESNFLGAVKASIYDNTVSPYLKLLNIAGCEYGDLEKKVPSDGVESTLKELYRAGVYVTLEEFKGRREIKRGSGSFAVNEGDFDVPKKSSVISGESGATRSAGTRTSYDFDYLASYAVHRSIMLSAAGAFGVPTGLWWPILPGGGPKMLLTLTKAGLTPVKWFSQVGGRGTGTTFKDRMATRYIVQAARLFGNDLPAPEYARLDEADKVAMWMAAVTQRGRGCCLLTYPSSAVRVCRAAQQNALDISGSKFIGGGEPFTEAKRNEVESVGATFLPIYAFVEAGTVGLGCTNPAAAGDVHFLDDEFAVIQHKRDVPHSGISVDAFLFSTLLTSAPKVMLNTESGDYGDMENVDCGCEYHKLGFNTILSNIRGFDKLTAEGMTLVGTDLARIIEEVLPARFGGTSTDYQIVEEEDASGQTRMTVLVSPEIPNVDEEELIRMIVDSLPHGGITPDVWSAAHTFRLQRISPMATRRGKLLPLHILRNK